MSSDGRRNSLLASLQRGVLQVRFGGFQTFMAETLKDLNAELTYNSSVFHTASVSYSDVPQTPVIVEANFHDRCNEILLPGTSVRSMHSQTFPKLL
jgi:hypothetical protein